MRTLIIALAFLALGLGSASADVDDTADVTVARPSFARDTGPIVAVDAGHFNVHTIDNLYRPFAGLLRNDGFRVAESKASFTSDSLAALNVLVIATLCRATRSKTGPIRRPPPSPRWKSTR